MGARTLPAHCPRAIPAQHNDCATAATDLLVWNVAVTDSPDDPSGVQAPQG